MSVRNTEIASILAPIENGAQLKAALHTASNILIDNVTTGRKAISGRSYEAALIFAWVFSHMPDASGGNDALIDRDLPAHQKWIDSLRKSITERLKTEKSLSASPANHYARKFIVMGIIRAVSGEFIDPAEAMKSYDPYGRARLPTPKKEPNTVSVDDIPVADVAQTQVMQAQQAPQEPVQEVVAETITEEPQQPVQVTHNDEPEAVGPKEEEEQIDMNLGGEADQETLDILNQL